MLSSLITSAKQNSERRSFGEEVHVHIGEKTADNITYLDRKRSDSNFRNWGRESIQYFLSFFKIVQKAMDEQEGRRHLPSSGSDEHLEDDDRSPTDTEKDGTPNPTIKRSDSDDTPDNPDQTKKRVRQKSNLAVFLATAEDSKPPAPARRKEDPEQPAGLSENAESPEDSKLPALPPDALLPHSLPEIEGLSSFPSSPIKTPPHAVHPYAVKDNTSFEDIGKQDAVGEAGATIHHGLTDLSNSFSLDEAQIPDNDSDDEDETSENDGNGVGDDIGDNDGDVHSESNQYSDLIRFEPTQQELNEQPGPRKRGELRNFYEFKRQVYNYIQQHGHSNVPQERGDPLSNFVNRMRNYKREGSLSDFKTQQLEEIGFTWARSRDVWDERFSELEEFRIQNGHCESTSIILPAPLYTHSPNRTFVWSRKATSLRSILRTKNWGGG